MPALRNAAPLTQSGSNAVITQTQTVAQFTSGPIPDAESLVKYGAIIPDAPERILRMAEKQSDHRQHLEKYVIHSDSRRANLGVLCAFIITMTVVLSGAYIVLQGHEIPGTIFTGLGLVGLAGTFIYGTQSRKEERLRRDAQNKALVKQR